MDKSKIIHLGQGVGFGILICGFGLAMYFVGIMEDMALRNKLEADRLAAEKAIIENRRRLLAALDKIATDKSLDFNNIDKYDGDAMLLSWCNKGFLDDAELQTVLDKFNGKNDSKKINDIITKYRLIIQSNC